MKFPFIGSAVLLSLFVAFKFLPANLVNAALTLYFASLGTAALAASVLPFVEALFPVAVAEKSYSLVKGLKIPYVLDVSIIRGGGAERGERERQEGGRERDKEKTLNSKLSTPLKTLTLLSQEPTDLSLTVPELASGAAASLFALWYAMKKHWLSNNALGLAFSITGVEHLSLGAVSTGVILLSGLFFYDIFWVFCTPVMVTVAKAFDAPIKLLFPRFGGGPVAARLAAAAGVAADGKGLSPFSMLGLGDIVIPGVFVALLLRFDCLPERQQRLRGAKAGAAAAARATTRASSAGAAKEKKKFLSSCPYPYFAASFFGYVLGLGTTIVIMNVFNAAQPALLYIVPAVLGATAVAGAARGELKAVFSFSEEPEEEEGEEKKEGAEKKEKKKDK